MTQYQLHFLKTNIPLKILDDFSSDHEMGITLLIVYLCIYNKLFFSPFFCRLMTPDSEIRFVHKEMGIIPSWGGTSRLVQIIGSRQALKVLSGALRLDSQKALNIGMVEEVLQSSDEVKSLEEAQEWLKQFTSGPPEVIRALKKSVCSGKELYFEEALQNERDLLGTLWGGSANLEAIARKKKFKN